MRAFPGRGVEPAGIWERVGHALLGAAALAILIVGSRVEPSGQGHGSHVQLGMPPCGWVVAFGRPCPTCGMTTAVAHATRGDLLSAFVTQPAGLAVAIACALTFWMSAHIVVTGSGLGRLVGREVFRGRILWGLAALVLGSWAYKFVTW